VQHRGDSAPRGIPRGPHRQAGFPDRQQRRGERRTIADRGWIEAKLLPRAQDRRTVLTNRSGDKECVSRLQRRRTRRRARQQFPQPGRIQEQAIQRPARHDLRIPGNDQHAARRRGLLQAVEHLIEHRPRQSLLDQQSQCEPPRPRAIDREIVDRPADRQRADVSAGKHQRRDGVAVGGDGDLPSRQFQPGRIAQLVENGIAKPRQQPLLNQLPGQPAPFAIRQRDAVPAVLRQRASFVGGGIKRRHGGRCQKVVDAVPVAWIEITSHRY
jgi:hypothetical protein